MRRRRKWTRRISRVVGTLAIGGMLGYLVPTLVAEFTPQPAAAPSQPVQARVAELPIAHAFIVAYLHDDETTLTQLGASADIRLRASKLTTDYKRIDDPVHLGSMIDAGITWAAYSTKVLKADGTEDLLGWRVITAGGQVALILPPSPIETNP